MGKLIHIQNNSWMNMFLRAVLISAQHLLFHNNVRTSKGEVMLIR